MRTALAISSLCMGLASATAHADAVDPCPPGFRSSHWGCRFDPGPQDLGICAGCACVIVGLGTFSALLLWRRRGASGPREGVGGGS